MTDTSTEATLQRYWNPQGGGVEPHDAGLLYLRDDVDAVIAAVSAERNTLRAERERLALVICGGEDAPGYAGTQTVEALESVAMQNRNMHASTVNSLLRAETERDALRAEVERLRYVLEGVRGAIDTGRNEPLQIWRDQIAIALQASAALKGGANG